MERLTLNVMLYGVSNPQHFICRKVQHLHGFIVHNWVWLACQLHLQHIQNPMGSSIGSCKDEAADGAAGGMQLRIPKKLPACLKSVRQGTINTCACWKKFMQPWNGTWSLHLSRKNHEQ